MSGVRPGRSPVCDAGQSANTLVLIEQEYSSAYFFFFSSRRRHTRFDCDWSSDVCSSDLFTKKRNFLAQNGKVEELGFEGIVNIRGVVSNFVDPVDELRFQGRAQIEKVFGKLRKLRGGIIARMLDDAFANFKRKIQPGKIEIALLELFHDAERVQIVIETPA